MVYVQLAWQNYLGKFFGGLEKGRFVVYETESNNARTKQAS